MFSHSFPINIIIEALYAGETVPSLGLGRRDPDFVPCIIDSLALALPWMAPSQWCEGSKHTQSLFPLF